MTFTTKTRRHEVSRSEFDKANGLVQRRKQNSGFTLFELMVVLALIAVASALVLPSVGHALGNVELRSGAASVISLLAQARTRAVYEGRSYAVVFGPADDAARSLHLVRDDGKQVQQVTLPAHLRLRAENPDGQWNDEAQPLYFFPDGTSQPAQLDLSSPGGRHVQVALDPLTARARVTQVLVSEEEQP